MRVFIGDDSVDNLVYFSAANEWLAEKRLDDLKKLLEEYIKRAFQSPDSTQAPEEWIAADMILNLERRRSEHSKCGFLLNIRSIHKMLFQSVQ